MGEIPRDPTLLPLESESDLLASWYNEALQTAPSREQWADFFVHLRWAWEAGRRNINKDGLPEGMTGPEMALKAVLDFLYTNPSVMQHGANMPLFALYGAIGDLANGRLPPILKPRVRRAGHPGRSSTDAMRAGISARAMDLLMKAGCSKSDAAKEVANTFGKSVTAAKVQRWRDEMREGGCAEAGSPLSYYQLELPPGDPRQQAYFLLSRLNRAKRKSQKPPL